jgi:hypothetical protein
MTGKSNRKVLERRLEQARRMAAGADPVTIWKNSYGKGASCGGRPQAGASFIT